jgi:hypothetical protein
VLKCAVNCTVACLKSTVPHFSSVYDWSSSVFFMLCRCSFIIFLIPSLTFSLCYLSISSFSSSLSPHIFRFLFLFTYELPSCCCRWSSNRPWNTRSSCSTRDGHPATQSGHFSVMDSSVIVCKWVMCVYPWHPGLRIPKGQRIPVSDAGLPLISSVTTTRMHPRRLLPWKGKRTKRLHATSKPRS